MNIHPFNSGDKEKWIQDKYVNKSFTTNGFKSLEGTVYTRSKSIFYYQITAINLKTIQ